MQAPFEPAIATWVDLGDQDGAAGTDGRADQRRAAMAGGVGARAAAGLDVQVLGHAAGEVAGPTDVAAGVGEGLGQVEHVDAFDGGQLGERDHAEASGSP
jgi:hypothetical protein